MKFLSNCPVLLLVLKGAQQILGTSCRTPFRCDIPAVCRETLGENRTSWTIVPLHNSDSFPWIQRCPSSASVSPPFWWCLAWNLQSSYIKNFLDILHNFIILTFNILIKMGAPIKRDKENLQDYLKNICEQSQCNFWTTVRISDLFKLCVKQSNKNK